MSFWWTKLIKTSPKFKELSVCVYRDVNRRSHELIKAVVPNGCSAGQKGAATSSEGIRGHFYATATLKFPHFLIKGIK
jgi:hypothetical protein